jgi:hypothetical protein
MKVDLRGAYRLRALSILPDSQGYEVGCSHIQDDNCQLTFSTKQENFDLFCPGLHGVHIWSDLLTPGTIYYGVAPLNLTER